MHTTITNPCGLSLLDQSVEARQCAVEAAVKTKHRKHEGTFFGTFELFPLLAYLYLWRLLH